MINIFKQKDGYISRFHKNNNMYGDYILKTRCKHCLRNILPLIFNSKYLTKRDKIIRSVSALSWYEMSKEWIEYYAKIKKMNIDD